METTFISIHDLTEDARILYTSDSVIDILGYTPDELVNRSAWEFFSEHELPYARKFHQKRVSQDKAAVLAYCGVKDKTGQMVGCECCFTVVYDVMIVCTSIYKRGLNSEKRALEAPIVRRIFTNSPKDPRYHMLSHISTKFGQPAKAQEHEPRAALFLNRFTRTMTIMYATAGIQDIIGISSDDMRGRSFYYCIAENCLTDAIKCLENAKGNDSIAYLRFWFRDPRQDDVPVNEHESDEEMTEASLIDDDSSADDQSRSDASLFNDSPTLGRDSSSMDIDDETKPESRTSSGESTAGADTHEGIFGHSLQHDSSASSVAASPERDRISFGEPIEIEAVISCTSDGLVVCMRKARPMIPHPLQRPSKPVYENGLFAAPWATEPVLPPMDQRAGAGFGTSFAPALGPQGANHPAVSPPRAAASSPDQSDFMNAIRDQAIFAWGLTGINGSLADFSRGKPAGESMPEAGLPIWESESRQFAGINGTNGVPNGLVNGTHTGISNGWSSGHDTSSASSNTPDNGRNGPQIFGDPGLDRNGTNSTGNGSSANGTGNGDGTNGTSTNGSSGAGTPYPDTR